MLIFYIISICLGILWFVDEILSFKNIKKFSLKYNKPPMISWVLHHHAKGLIYLKIVMFLFFIYLAAEIWKQYFMFFHIFVLILVIVYLIFDIEIQRKVR